MDITHFNPRLQDEASFLAGFVARQSNLGYFLKQLELATPHQPASHHLIVAPRGYGKTSLLRRIAIAIRTQPDLHKNFVALSFREEQHNILSLDFFWHNCLVSLLETREIEKAAEPELSQLEALADTHKVRSALPREAQDGDPAWQALLEATAALQRRPVLLIDNLDSLLRGLPDAHQWQLRRVLQSADGPVLLAAASAYPESVSEHKAAFFDFFRVHTLDRLTDQEVMHCLAEIASHRGEPGQKVLQQLQENAGRIAALNTMAGGNPRTLGVLYKVLEAHMSDDIMAQLGQMLDTFTGWYQARTEELPTQGRAVFDALALHWDPITAAALSEATGLDTPSVSSQISRLEKSGHVEAVKLSRTGKGRSAYQVAERFYNVWYLMRNGSLRATGKVRFLAVFLQGVFTASERKRMARDLLTQAHVPAHYALALSSTLTDSRLQRNLLRQAEEGTTLQAESAELNRMIHQERAKLETTSRKANGFAKGEQSTTSDTKSIHKLALELIDAGRFDEAEGVYRKAINLDPNAYRIWNGLGNLLANHFHRFVEANAAYLQAITLQPKSARLWFNLGNLQAKLARYEEAETSYRKAIELDVNFAAPWNNVGNLLKNHLGRYEEAELAYRQAIALESNDARLWHNLGTLLQDHFGRYEEAEAAHRRAIAIDGKLANPWNSLGNLMQLQLGRHEEAEAAYRRAIEIDAKYAKPWNGLGNLLQHHLGRHPEAELAYRQAIALDSKYGAPWSNLGNLLQNYLGRYEEAEATYRQAIALDVEGAAPWFSLGHLLQNHLDRYDEAEAAYRKAIVLDVQNAAPWHNLGGLLQHQLHRYDDAEVAYRQAIKLNPNIADPWNGLGVLLAHHLGRNEEAEAAFRKALAIDEKSWGVWFNLAVLLQEVAGRSEESVIAFRQVVLLNPEFSLAWLFLGQVLHLQLERYEEAKEAYQQAWAGKSTFGQAWLWLGNLLQDCLGRPEDAVSVFREAVAHVEEDVQLDASAAYVEALRTGALDSARAHAQRALNVDSRLSGTAKMLLRALPCFWTAPESWAESWRHIQAAVEAEDSHLFTDYLDDLQRLLSWLVTEGQGEFVLDQMQAAKFPDKYAPLYHAMKAAIESEDYLLRINPETRAPALKIYTGLARMIRLYPPRKK